MIDDSIIPFFVELMRNQKQIEISGSRGKRLKKILEIQQKGYKMQTKEFEEEKLKHNQEMTNWRKHILIQNRCILFF